MFEVYRLFGLTVVHGNTNVTLRQPKLKDARKSCNYYAFQRRRALGSP